MHRPAAAQISEAMAPQLVSLEEARQLGLGKKKAPTGQSEYEVEKETQSLHQLSLLF